MWQQAVDEEEIGEMIDSFSRKGE